ncbi:transmembrane protein 216-like [Neocloeon triangulifer]|uniref:transmembrane protein 216-like n=1 Tax=Neocloeon triangulifer TaxID=2078957 RepID=UPI00286F83C9|nr:transmembrane protein 216-like [Neocloeon triangulifer]
MGSSLTLQILLYLSTFYFGMFMLCEFGLLIFKGMHLPYPSSGMWIDGILLILLGVIESFRLLEGQKANLTNMQNRMAVSLALCIPSSLAVIYFAAWQNYVLRLELILCIIQLGMQLIEFVLGAVELIGR